RPPHLHARPRVPGSGPNLPRRRVPLGTGTGRHGSRAGRDGGRGRCGARRVGRRGRGAAARRPSARGDHPDGPRGSEADRDDGGGPLMGHSMGAPGAAHRALGEGGVIVLGIETSTPQTSVALGIPSLDVLAFGVRYTRRLIGAVIDARRGEVFHALYRGVPGGVMRVGEYGVAPPGHLAAELEAAREEVLLVGNGAILYRKELEEVGSRVECTAAAQAHPQ